MEESVVEKLRDNMFDAEQALIISEEELKETRENLKKFEEKFKQVKSSVYQATKYRNELKLKLKRARTKAGSYLSQRRVYGKKNMGKIISGFVEEDL